MELGLVKHTRVSVCDKPHANDSKSYTANAHNTLSFSLDVIDQTHKMIGIILNHKINTTVDTRIWMKKAITK